MFTACAQSNNGGSVSSSDADSTIPSHNVDTTCGIHSLEAEYRYSFNLSTAGTSVLRADMGVVEIGPDEEEPVYEPLVVVGNTGFGDGFRKKWQNSKGDISVQFTLVSGTNPFSTKRSGVLVEHTLPSGVELEPVNGPCASASQD